MYFVGDGAERVDEYLREHFPNARIARLDRDTVRTKREYQQVLGAFATAKSTCSSARRWSPKATISSASRSLASSPPISRSAAPISAPPNAPFSCSRRWPDAPAAANCPAKFSSKRIIPSTTQFNTPRKQDYVSFYEKEAHFRRMLHYPPFAALASVLMRDKKIENAIRWSRALAAYFAPFEERGVKILGPAAAPLARLRQEYRFQFLLKSPQRSALSQALSGALDFCAKKEIPETAVIVDVDPTSLF